MNQDIQDYTRAFSGTSTTETEDFFPSVMRKVYGWMCTGLLLSAGVAWYFASSGLYTSIFSTAGFIFCIILELALVIGLSRGIRKMSAGMAVAMFLLYAAVNGATLSFVFLVYELGSVLQVFCITAGMFGGLALFGSLTKKDLSGVGAVFGMALWGIILLSVVNIFAKSERIDWALSLVGVIVFSGLTAWDAQKAKTLARAIPEQERGGQTVAKLGILCALQLYLDFVNLFLYLLRIFGGKGRR